MRAPRRPPHHLGAAPPTLACRLQEPDAQRGQ